MESINDRIQKLLIEKGISASEFSKKINVQRSSISHIINGRNKPSLEIVTKICKVYPDVKLDWLIFGENYDSIPYATVAHITTGRFNIFCKVRCKDTDHAKEIIFMIDDIEGVSRTETMISLEESINDKKRLMHKIFNEIK